MDTQKPINTEIGLEDALKLVTSEHLERVGLNADGTVWFRDTQDGVCYKVKRNESGLLAIAETRETKAQGTTKPRTVTIECCECGEERTIASQDAFQVTRCEPCQRKHRNHKRAERAKVKRTEKRNGKLLETLNVSAE